MKRKPPVTRSIPGSWSATQPARDRELLFYALVVSLYVHGMLLLLRFGAPGLGLPGLAWPWLQERVQAPPLQVRVEAPRPPPLPPVKLRLSPELAKAPASPAQAAAPPRAVGTFDVRIARAKPAPPPPRAAAAPPPAPKPRVRKRKPKSKPQPTILAQTDPQEETFKVPPPDPAKAEARAREQEAKRVEAARIAKQAAEDAARKEAEAAARIAEAERLAAEEAARLAAEAAARIAAEEEARLAALEAARLAAEEAARRTAEDEARQRALSEQRALEAKKRAATRKEEEAERLALELEASRVAEENARKEAGELERQRALALAKEREAEEEKEKEKARALALEAEAVRLAEEAAKQAAQRKKELAAQRQKELEARRLAEEAAARAKDAAERARAEAEAAAQRERDRLAAQQAPGTGPGTQGTPTAPALSGRDLAAKALDQLRTPGAARDALTRAPRPPPRFEKGRRRSVLGVERDVSIRMYVESWRNKIERNGGLNYRPSAGLNARDNPVVTVSIRRDGTLEDVVIHRSSGLRELDEAVLRIAELNAPYSAFPPDLARQYDVIEIRRIWFFDRTLKIMDEF